MSLKGLARLSALVLAAGSMFALGTAQADTPLTLTLLGPTTFRTAQPIAPYTGKLSLGAAGIPLASLDVLVDGTPAAVASTDVNGNYSVTLPPFATPVNHTVRTRAFTGSQLEELSPLLTVKPLFQLTVVRTGSGSGTVTSSPAGISCGSTCSMFVANGTSVSLTAIPNTVSSFGGWGGACSGTGNCSFVMSTDKSVSAAFNPLPPAQLSVTPPFHDFGQMVVGSSSSDFAFTVTNSGGLPSGVPALALAGADVTQFAISSNGCASPLGAGQSCTATVRFVPASTGSKNATLTATASPGGTVSSTLQGIGVAPAQLVITPPNYDFGLVDLNTDRTVAFNVQNTGGVASGPLVFNTSGPDASQFSVAGTTCGSPLAPTQQCQITIRFAPNSPGLKNATLMVNATPGGSVNAMLQGTGATPAQLVINPSSFNYGTVSTSSFANANFTVINAGQSMSGPIGFSFSGSNASDFHIVGTSCAGPLPGGASCGVTVQFSPSSFGGKNATFLATASPGGTATSGLSGTGSF
ncbi:MAG: choice-of-anchor D domain-containing protein [Actinomycetota bacterium]|nr:choice-of-anchor D domain-containing protein [Actinomycetota bacterium]